MQTRPHGAVASIPRTGQESQASPCPFPNECPSREAAHRSRVTRAAAFSECLDPHTSVPAKPNATRRGHHRGSTQILTPVVGDGVVRLGVRVRRVGGSPQFSHVESSTTGRHINRRVLGVFMPAGCSRPAGPSRLPVADKRFGISVENRLALLAAEVVRTALVPGRGRCFPLVHVHAAHWIFRHDKSPRFSVPTCGASRRVRRQAGLDILDRTSPRASRSRRRRPRRP